jgi:primosomal protein N' (replication factor Y)
LRRWLAAGALARPSGEGGRVVAVGDPGDRVLQALVRWDPAGFAGRELEERRSAHLPPASRLATISGPDADVTAALAALRLPPGAEVLGPVPVSAPARATDDRDEPAVRAVLRVPRGAGPALSRALVELQGVRDARKLPPVRVQVDPVALG